MKLLIVICLLISVAVALPQVGIAANEASAAPSSVGASKPGYVNPYGPKVYGRGLNNPYSLPPNQFVIQRALKLANSHAELLVRVDIDGDVTLTDKYGQEVDGLYDRFGYDLTELYDI